MKNYLHNFSLWVFFFFSIWLGSLVFLWGLQREPGETKICTWKRIRNRSSIGKLVKTIYHNLKCKYSRNKNNRKPSSIFFVLLFLCKKNPTIQISNPLQVFQLMNDFWLFLCIFLSHLVLFEAPLERPKGITISRRRKRLRVKNYLHNFHSEPFSSSRYG